MAIILLRKTMKLYHYTYGNKLASIQKEGLRTSNPGVPAEFEPGIGKLAELHAREKPILWLSSNEYFENSALKPEIIGNKKSYMPLEQAAKRIGIYRFTMPEHLRAEAKHWSFFGGELRKQAKISMFEAKRMTEAGKKFYKANPVQWFGLVGDSIRYWPQEGWKLEKLTFPDQSGKGQWFPTSICKEVALYMEREIQVISLAGWKAV